MVDRFKKEQNRFVGWWDETNSKDRKLSRKIARKRLNKQDQRDLIEEYKHDVFEEDFVEEIEKALFENWGICDKCGSGFRLLYKLNDQDEFEQINGYHKETDMMLCDECWGKQDEIKD